MKSKWFLLAAICLGLIAPASSRPMLNGRPCVVQATDPTSGFPYGFSVCWSPNERISMARPETLELLARPSTYDFPNHSAAVAYVILGFRPEHDARILLSRGKLYLMVDPLGDPKGMPRIVARQMDLADRLKKEFNDFIEQTRSLDGTWRSFFHDGQEGFEPLGAASLRRVQRPALNTERFESLKQLCAKDPPRCQVENDDYLPAKQDLDQRLRTEGITDGESRLYCYSQETGSFSPPSNPPPGLLDMLEQDPRPNQELFNLTRCWKGVLVTSVGGYMPEHAFDLRDAADRP